MNINWRVRIKNKAFWLALIPAVLLLVQVVAAVFGIGDSPQAMTYEEPKQNHNN